MKPARISDVLTTDAARSLALVDHNGGHIGHEAFYNLIETVAGWLRALRVGQGDRVLLVAENGVLYAAALLAANRLDAWAVLVNARQSDEEIRAVCAHASSRLTLYLTKESEAAAARAKATGASFLAVTPFGPLICRANRRAPLEVCPAEPAERVAALFYTSGTTGTPRGVMLTDANILWTAQTSARLRLRAKTRGDERQPNVMKDRQTR